MLFGFWQNLRPRLGAIRSTFKWVNDRYSTPSPHYVKQATLLRNMAPGSVFIETGTYKGATSLYMRKHGFKVATIEIHKPLFDIYSTHLKKQGIDARLGDSASVLPLLLEEYRGEAAIAVFLDGHYSGGITGQGDMAVPVVREFESLKQFILQHPEIHFTVMVDDVRLFMPGGDPVYPKKGSLIEFANIIKGHWNIEHDIFICTRAKA